MDLDLLENGTSGAKVGLNSRDRIVITVDEVV